MAGRRIKGGWLLLALASAVGLITCLSLLVRPTDPVAFPTPTPVAETAAPARPEPSPTPEQFPLEIPVDFTALQTENPDIYAWIQMPGTPLDYPIVQRFGDDGYYLRRDTAEKYAIAGSIFTESSYNGTDFSDPVTLVYGHDMKDGSMFGSLQMVLPTMALDEDAVFYIYQPDRRLTYRIFAAVPYSSRHVLYYHNFREERKFNAFFDDIFSIRDLSARLDPEHRPSTEDRVVILSTRLQGDNTRRFLVMGVEIEDARTEPS